MLSINKFALSAGIAAMLTISIPVTAQEGQIEVEIPENSVLSDGKLTKEELARYAVIGQQQLVKLTERATEEYTERLKNEAGDSPAAWMLLDDGETIKQINIDGQNTQAPDNVRILMYRAALKSIARRGKINAAVILYTGKLKEGEDAQALVIEHEHRLGISANKIVPFTVKEGKVSYSEPVTKEKPFQMFYDDKGQAPANQS
jgi:hypothetical protein